MRRNILFFQHRGTCSRDIFTDIIDGYREAGHNVFVLELAPIWDQVDAISTPESKKEATRQVGRRILEVVTTHKIDFCVCMWGNGPATLDNQGNEDFFDTFRLPILLHWLDAPQWAHESKVLDTPRWVFTGPYRYHYINNAATAQEMAGVLGFSNIITLGNAASPTTFTPRHVDEKEFDIVFGVAEDTVEPTPTMLKELQRDEPDVEAIRADKAASLHDRLCDIVRPLCTTPTVVGPLVDKVIEARLKCRHAAIMEQLSQVARAAPGFANSVLTLLQDPKRYVDFSSTLRQIESWERAFTFVYLSRHFRCATFGFKPAFQAWPGRWEHLGELPYHEQAIAYGRGSFGLNVMRWQDDVGLNLKPFEITLSGTCLLQAHRAGIEHHFNSPEVVTFHTPYECRARVRELLADPDQIARIAAAGRARSLRQHCWRHRAEAAVRAVPRHTTQHVPEDAPEASAAL